MLSASVKWNAVLIEKLNRTHFDSNYILILFNIVSFFINVDLVLNKVLKKINMGLYQKR